MNPEFSQPASIIVEQERRKNPRLNVALHTYQTFMRRYGSDVLHPGMAQEQAIQLQNAIASSLAIHDTRPLHLIRSAQLLHHLRDERRKIVYVRGGRNEAEAFSTSFLLKMVKQQEKMPISLFIADNESMMFASALIEVTDATYTGDFPDEEELPQLLGAQEMFLFVATAPEIWEAQDAPKLHAFGMEIIKEDKTRIDFPNGFFS